MWLLQPGLSRDGICIFVCDSLSTISSQEHRMNIFIKNSRTLLVAAAMVLGVTATTGGVYAQQSTDKAKMADKSTSTDKNRPSSRSGKEDGEMIVEVPVVVCPGAGFERSGDGQRMLGEVVRPEKLSR